MEKGKDSSLMTAYCFYRKIMPSVLREHRLVLPKKFVEEHGGELSSKIQLDLPVNGDKWYIGLKKSGDLIYLNHGWKKFMNHYSIRFGWLLLFKYKENSVFDVHIFDLTATEIQYPPPPLPPAVVIGDDAGEMYKPSFNVTLTDKHVRRYTMNLPSKFMRKHMNDCPEFIRIVDCDKKIWRVRCVTYGDRKCLGQGWIDFVKKKGLNIGDVCVFEVLKKNDILKVDVFYATKTKGGIVHQFA